MDVKLKTEVDIRAELPSLFKTAGSQSAYARSIGISPQYMSRVVHGKKPLTPAMLDALGYEKITLYRRKTQ